VSAALSEEQRAILERRGALAPEELRRLAGKTRRAMGAEPGRHAVCHSEAASPERARELQRERLDPVTLAPLDADAPGH
jgi:phosphomethylpyrimidine synthase